jgi:DNA repair protein RadC
MEDTPMQTQTMKLRELTVRYSVKKTDAGEPVVVGRVMNSPRDSAAALMAVLQDQPNEVFAILCLSTKHRVIAYHEVSRGTLDSTLVHPREVFKAALLANAAAIIVVHNHPSGDPSPAIDDLEVTTRLVAAGEILGVPVLDHIVVGEGKYFSFKEAGRL